MRRLVHAADTIDLRTFAFAALATSAAALVGCGSSSTEASSSDAGVEAARPASDTASQADRSACKFARGALPSETLGPSTPLGKDILIDNIVVVMMENHSFDSYFGHLNAYGNRTDIESAPANATNPDTAVDGGVAPFVHAPHLCSLDTDHGWDGTHIEIDNGKMDGFAQRNEGTTLPTVPAGGLPLDPAFASGARSLWWYDQRDLPYYYKLANTFAVADHYFCSVPGPTWPNRRYLYAGTSFGGTVTNLPTVLENESKYPYPGTPANPYNPATVLDELEKSKVPWMYYSDGQLPTLYLLYSNLNRWGRTVTGTFAAFQAAASAGTLPSVSFVDPPLNIGAGSGSEADEHPPGDIEVGQQFVSQVVKAAMSGPQWAHTAVFITHDEHGGFYDHVAPPPACVPDAIKPILTGGDTMQGAFDMLGVRVVLMAVSPYSKKGYVGHHVYDHTSIMRFIEARFDLAALTARDANAEPLTDLFDFTSPPAFATPPTIPDPTVDPTELTYCTQTFGM
jgi:phospholipase C